MFSFYSFKGKPLGYFHLRLNSNQLSSLASRNFFFLTVYCFFEKCVTGKNLIRHAIMHSSLFAQNLKLRFYIGITSTVFFRFSYIFSFSIVVFPVFRYSTEFYTVLYCKFVFYSPPALFKSRNFLSPTSSSAKPFGSRQRYCM